MSVGKRLANEGLSEVVFEATAILDDGRLVTVENLPLYLAFTLREAAYRIIRDGERQLQEKCEYKRGPDAIRESSYRTRSVISSVMLRSCNELLEFGEA